MHMPYVDQWVPMGCGIKANCLLKEPGADGGVPFVGVLLRNPSPYLCEFGIKTTDNSERLGR